MRNTAPTRQSVKTATNKSRGSKPTACDMKGGSFSTKRCKPNGLLLLTKTIFYNLFVFCYLVVILFVSFIISQQTACA
jgi:hypothetical protein